jgi:ATP-dependent DNA ligase
VRCLLHVEGDRVRLTSRCISGITYRLGEFQENVPHLATGWSDLDGTILDGELICPVAELDTGSSNTAHRLQAAVAILATSPANTIRIQQRHNAHLRLHVFDVLRFRGADVTGLRLLERLDIVQNAVRAANNPHLDIVPSYVINKPSVHDHNIGVGGEGTVWKKIDEPYEPGRRVKQWIKRKRGTEIEAFVTGFKPGTPERGHAHLIGAVEFSRHDSDGGIQPVAWVSGWTDAERQAMTIYDGAGNVHLHPSIRGRWARIAGQDLSAKSKRLRHAKMRRWLSDKAEFVPMNGGESNSVAA